MADQDPILVAVQRIASRLKVADDASRQIMSFQDTARRAQNEAMQSTGALAKELEKALGLPCTRHLIEELIRNTNYEPSRQVPE